MFYLHNNTMQLKPSRRELFKSTNHGPHYSYFKYSTNTSMKVDIVHALELGELPDELI